MTANRYAVHYALVALFPLLRTAKIILLFRWVVRRKIPITNGIVANAGKWNALLPGSIMRGAWIAFWSVIKKPIVLSCESSSSATT